MTTAQRIDKRKKGKKTTLSKERTNRLTKGKQLRKVSVRVK